MTASPRSRVSRTASALVAATVLTIAATLSAQQAPTFRTATALVTTDIIPRDASGMFVSDLKADDFTILEDGVPQTIVSFAMVHGGRTLNLLAPPAATPEGIVLPNARPLGTNEAGGRVFVIVVDDLHFEPEYTPHARQLVGTLADTLLRDGDLVAMVSTGPSSIEISATYDRTLIAASVSRIRGSALTPAEIFQMPETSQGIADLRQRARAAFQSAHRMIGQLEVVRDKRKAVIYISSGYDFDPFPAGRQSRDLIAGGRSADPTRFTVDVDDPYLRLPAITSDIDLFAYMKELTLSANRVNATIHTIDPRGLAGVVDAGQAVDQSEWRAFLQKTQSSLRFLAEETGGFAVVNTNDFASEMRKIDVQTSNYYLIGYYSTNSEIGKRTRTLDVSVRRHDVRVAARSAYSTR